jgi:hypothetical protein
MRSSKLALDAGLSISDVDFDGAVVVIIVEVVEERERYINVNNAFCFLDPRLTLCSIQ